MKRKWMLIFVVMLLSCLTACHGPSDGDNRQVPIEKDPTEKVKQEKLSAKEWQWLQDHVKASAIQYEDFLKKLPGGSVDSVRQIFENTVSEYQKQPAYWIELTDDGEFYLCGEFIVDDKNTLEGHKHIFLRELLGEVPAEQDGQFYALTMKNLDWLYEKLQDSYKEGDTVTVKIHVATDIGYLLMANGEKVYEDKNSGNGDWWQFSFVMPAEDVVLEFKTYDGILQYAEEAIVMEEFWLEYPESDYVAIQNYYGEFESGAIVAMINSRDYTQALWEENIAYFNIRYNNGNRILVLYNGAFFTLTDAYNKGHLTNQDMADIENTHRQYYEYLYSDAE